MVLNVTPNPAHASRIGLLLLGCVAGARTLRFGIGGRGVGGADHHLG
jgi:hypothetical protein